MAPFPNLTFDANLQKVFTMAPPTQTVKNELNAVESATLEAVTSTLRTYSAFGTGFRHTARFISAKQLNATGEHVILSSSQKSGQT